MLATDAAGPRMPPTPRVAVGTCRCPAVSIFPEPAGSARPTLDGGTRGADVDFGPVETITSRRNPLAARFRRAARREAGDRDVLIEGPRLVEDALAAGLRIDVAAVSTAPAPRAAALARRLEPAARVVRVPAAVMDALSPAATPSGLVALAALSPAPLEDALRVPRPLVVGLSGVQDPGNTGAAVRAVEAGGASGVVAVGGADPFGWKALRGAMGSAFRLPVARADDPAAVARLAAAHGLRVIAAAPRGGTPAAEVDLRGPCLVWLGAEGSGLDGDAAATADETVSIPMRPPVESLNLAVAAALIVYEAARQRGGVTPAAAGATPAAPVAGLPPGEEAPTAARTARTPPRATPTAAGTAAAAGAAPTATGTARRAPRPA